MLTASLKRVFGKLLWKLFLSARGLSKLPFHGGISSVTLPSETKHAFNRMKRTWLLRDIIVFKRCRAKARRAMLEAKSSSWRQFCTSLTSTTNLSKVWKVIKRFSRNRPTCFIPTLLAPEMSGVTFFRHRLRSCSTI